MTGNSLLQRAGEALYGLQWQSALARDLGISDRTMRRWAAGDSIPEGVSADLTALCKARIERLRETIAALR
jgi:DNA-binding transcriptional regulator YiaG